jgi:hypothetical protein
MVHETEKIEELDFRYRGHCDLDMVLGRRQERIIVVNEEAVAGIAWAV